MPSPDIILTPTHPSDAPELIRGNIESRSYHLPWSEPFLDQRGFDGWFLKTQYERYFSLVARERQSNAIVGLINFSEVAGSNSQSADTGYYGMVRFAGRGLMTQALRASVHYAFDHLNLHRLEANIRPENIRSSALVQRVGFRREGFSPNYLFIDGAWRSHERWVVFKEDIDVNA